MRQILFPSLLLLAMQFSASASSIEQFPKTSNPETAPCYLRTADGQSFDLTRICGQSEAASQSINSRLQNFSQQSLANPINSRIINSSFQAKIGVNPGNPFGTNPSSAQCYIIDSEGNAC